jgi:cytochrome c oxidase assembly protein subunit 11
MTPDLKQRNSQLVKKLVLAVVCMFGFGFALVPLYEVFCEITGLNGKTGGRYEGRAIAADLSREVRVQFITTNNESMPWEFYAVTPEIRVHPGQSVRVEFIARNPVGRTMTAQAVPSVSPSVGAQYFHKTECFCFNHQELKPGEEIRMPVIFVVDSALPADVRTLTLSYTLFDISDTLTKTKS